MNSTGCIEETSIQKLVPLVSEYLALQYAKQLEVKYKINLPYLLLLPSICFITFFHLQLSQ
jgi:hypothetical protein